MSTAGTDSELVTRTTVDVVLAAIAVAAGVGAPFAALLGIADTTGLAVAATAGLVLNLNLRLVAVLRRRKRRSANDEG